MTLALSSAWVLGPDGGLVPGAVQDNFAVIAQQFPLAPTSILGGLPVSVAPPASAVNGQDFFYALSGGGGWHFKYNSLTGKWDFYGGAALYAEVVTSETTTNTSYANLATAGPTVTLPLAADYDVQIGCRANNSSAAAQTFMSYAIGAVSASDNDALFNYANTVATTGDFGSRTRRKAGLAAVALTAKYRVTAGTGSFEARWISVLPTRI